MSELYSYKGAYPYPIPADMVGYTISDFTLADPKPELAADERLDWTGTAWSARKANLAETDIEGQNVRTKRNSLLQDSDIQILRAYESQTPVPPAVVGYRQALRDITSQTGFPWTITWPTP